VPTFADLCLSMPIHADVGRRWPSTCAYARLAHVDRSRPTVVCRPWPTLADLSPGRWPLKRGRRFALCLWGGLNAVTRTAFGTMHGISADTYIYTAYCTNTFNSYVTHHRPKNLRKISYVSQVTEDIFECPKKVTKWHKNALKIQIFARRGACGARR
jgi:hypothetical protein